MADNVTLLDLSFKTDEAVEGLDALIKKSLDLAEEKKQLTKQINAEKMALAGLRQNYKDNLIDQTAFEKATEKSETAIISLTKQLNNNKNETSENAAAIKAHTTIVNSEAESVETLRAKLALNTKALNKMSVEQRTNSEAGKQMVAQTKEISDKRKDLEKGVGDTRGSPDKSGGKFFNSIENLHLCTMNNQGLLALAQLILPSEILSNFEVVRVEEEASLIRIYLDESVKAEYKENPEIESKGFCEAVTIRDFPIRDKGVDLIVRRRKWYDKQNNRYFSDSYDLKAEETRYSKEFAAFLKGVYGDDSYDLPFA